MITPLLDIEVNRRDEPLAAVILDSDTGRELARKVYTDAEDVRLWFASQLRERPWEVRQ